MEQFIGVDYGKTIQAQRRIINQPACFYIGVRYAQLGRYASVQVAAYNIFVIKDIGKREIIFGHIQNLGGCQKLVLDLRPIQPSPVSDAGVGRFCRLIQPYFFYGRGRIGVDFYI